MVERPEKNPNIENENLIDTYVSENKIDCNKQGKDTLCGDGQGGPSPSLSFTSPGLSPFTVCVVSPLGLRRSGSYSPRSLAGWGLSSW